MPKMQLILLALTFTMNKFALASKPDPSIFRTNANKCEALISIDDPVQSGTCQTPEACEPYMSLVPFPNNNPAPGTGCANGETCCVKQKCALSARWKKTLDPGDYRCTNWKNFDDQFGHDYRARQHIYDEEQNEGILDPAFPFIIPNIRQEGQTPVCPGVATYDSFALLNAGVNNRFVCWVPYFGQTKSQSQDLGLVGEVPQSEIEAESGLENGGLDIDDDEFDTFV